MRYLPKSPSERQQMLAALGLNSVEELFSHLPESVRLDRPLDVPSGKSEYEIVDYFQARSQECALRYASFLGAGVYRHFRPVIIDPLATRGEFLTSYTPYQAEISQGVLTTIFEFQTMISQLTGMEVANASMYDGSTATPEAALMAARVTGRERLVVARTLHPEYRQVLDTSLRFQGLPAETVGYDQSTGQVNLEGLERRVTDETAAVIVQSPNYFGVIEQIPDLAAIAHKRGALLVVIFNEAVSLGLLRPPVEADIVAGELQSFAHPPSYGGPFCGVLAAKMKHIRHMPGRIVGETVDSEGRRSFCLTLATREQHIRRARATSNICTNQALVALMATIYMAVYGKQGLRELAEQNVAKSRFLAEKLTAVGASLPFEGAFFNEFAVRPGRDNSAAVNRRALERGVIGGRELGADFPELDGAMLVCATEMNRRGEIERFAEAF